MSEKYDDKGFMKPEGMLGEDGQFLPEAIQKLIYEHSLFGVLDAIVLYCEQARSGKIETLGEAREWSRIKRGLKDWIDREKVLFLED